MASSPSFLLLLRLPHFSASLLPSVNHSLRNFTCSSRKRRRSTLLFPAIITPARLSLSGKAPRSLADERSGGDGGALVQEDFEEVESADYSSNGVVGRVSDEAATPNSQVASFQHQRQTVSSDSISLGIREPVYEVIEVKSDGKMSTKRINRRQLLKSSGLLLRDIRSVDPSLWLTNSMPTLLVREQAILLNFGSLRAIAMHERVLVFDYNGKGGKAFLKSLLPRLNPKNINGGPVMPFELEVVEAALLSRIQRLERRLMDLEPRVSMEHIAFFPYLQVAWNRSAS